MRNSNLTPEISCQSATFIDHMEEVVQEIAGRGRIYATTQSVPLNGYYRRNEICLSPPASSQLYGTGIESSYN